MTARLTKEARNVEKEENKITLPKKKRLWECVTPIVVSIIVSTITAILLRK